MITARVPGKVVWLGEHAVQHGVTAVGSAIDMFVTVTFDDDAAGDMGAEHAAVWDAVQEVLVELLGGSRRGAAGILVASEIPSRMGLGSSSALVVGMVAVALRLRNLEAGHAEVFRIAREVERRHSGASGMDAAICVYGTVEFTLRVGAPRIVPTSFADACSVVLTDQAHEGTCHEPLPSEIVQTIQALPRVPESMPLAHAALCAAGLGFEGAACTRNVVPRAKMTGRCKGGALVCVPPLRPDEDAALRARGLRTVHLHVVEDAFRVTDARFEGVPRGLARKLVPVKPEGLGTAHSNIALVKYWGKRPLQLPRNASVSLALPYCRTETHVSLSADPRAQYGDARVVAFVRRALGLDDTQFVCIRTHNNFPSSCGVASSASGFAALARALADLVGVDDQVWIEQWARLGSGSATRSARDDELVSWTGSTCRAHAVAADMHLDHALVVFDPFPKAVGSSSGHEDAPTSPFFEVRAAHADDNVPALVRAFAESDFDTVRRVSEFEAMSMHMVMATQAPALRYVSDEAMGFVHRFVRFRDRFGLRALFTIDAGSNIHLLFAPDAATGVRRVLAAERCAFVLERGVRAYWYRAVVLSGKRYAGKTTLCEALCQRAGEGGVQVLTLSAAIKREYWEAHLKGRVSFDAFVANRLLKEEHRSRMVEFAEAALATHGKFYWLWKAWHALSPTPRTVIVSDARRSADLEFFAACTDCVTVRVHCSDAVRRNRGWTPSIVDTARSETGLDDARFDVVLRDTDPPRGVEELFAARAPLPHAAVTPERPPG